MIPIFMLGEGNVFQFPDGVGQWEIIQKFSEKVICEEKQTGKKAWFWSNRVVTELNNK